MTKQERIRRFRSDESGATAVEYALLCGLMTVALVGVLGTGGALASMYEWIQSVLEAIDTGAEEAE